MAIAMGDYKRKKCACCGKEFYMSGCGWAYKRITAKGTKYFAVGVVLEKMNRKKMFICIYRIKI